MPARSIVLSPTAGGSGSARADRRCRVEDGPGIVPLPRRGHLAPTLAGLEHQAGQEVERALTVPPPGAPLRRRANVLAHQTGAFGPQRLQDVLATGHTGRERREKLRQCTGSMPSWARSVIARAWSRPTGRWRSGSPCRCSPRILAVLVEPLVHEFRLRLSDRPRLDRHRNAGRVSHGAAAMPPRRAARPAVAIGARCGRRASRRWCCPPWRSATSSRVPVRSREPPGEPRLTESYRPVETADDQGPCDPRRHRPRDGPLNRAVSTQVERSSLLC